MGKSLVEAEFESIKRLRSYMPRNVVEPYGWIQLQLDRPAQSWLYLFPIRRAPRYAIAWTDRNKSLYNPITSNELVCNFSMRLSFANMRWPILPYGWLGT